MLALVTLTNIGAAFGLAQTAEVNNNEKDDEISKENIETTGFLEWKKDLLENEKVEWRKEILENLQDEEKARTITTIDEKWKAIALNNLSKDDHWKIPFILKSINDNHAKAMLNVEDKRKVEALANVSTNPKSPKT